MATVVPTGGPLARKIMTTDAGLGPRSRAVGAQGDPDRIGWPADGYRR